MSDLVTVATFTTANEAAVAQMLLDDLGIQAFVCDAELVSMDWFYANAIGYIKVQTRDDQAEAARTALQSWRAERQTRDRESREANGSADACLGCGAPLPPDRATCPACGWSYAGADDEPASAAGVEQAATTRADGPAGAAILDDEVVDGGVVDDGVLDGAADDEEAAERAETNATSLRLLIGLILFGLLAISLLPRLREFVQGR